MERRHSFEFTFSVSSLECTAWSPFIVAVWLFSFLSFLPGDTAAVFHSTLRARACVCVWPACLPACLLPATTFCIFLPTSLLPVSSFHPLKVRLEAASWITAQRSTTNFQNFKAPRNVSLGSHRQQQPSPRLHGCSFLIIFFLKRHTKKANCLSATFFCSPSSVPL